MISIPVLGSEKSRIGQLYFNKTISLTWPYQLRNMNISLPPIEYLIYPVLLIEFLNLLFQFQCLYDPVQVLDICQYSLLRIRLNLHEQHLRIDN